MTNIYVKSLGKFGVFVNGVEQKLKLAEIDQVILLSLLSPLDQYQNWERLCRAFNAKTDEIQKHILSISAYFITISGVNPVFVDEEGVALDRNIIRSDIDHLWRTIRITISLITNGKIEESRKFLSEAMHLASEEFAPQVNNRIVDRIREELNDSVRMILSNFKGSNTFITQQVTY